MTALVWGALGTGQISESVVADILGAGSPVHVVQGRSLERARAFADRHGIPDATADVSDVLSRDDVDIVYIATPFSTHRELVLQALAAGKHVLVEKPMATSEAEVSELFAAAQQAGVFLAEAMWMKFNPAFRRLVELTRDGTIGEPRTVRAGFGFPLPRDGSSRWRLDGSPSAMLDQGIYAIALAQEIFGEPEEIAARGLVDADLGIDLTTHITLSYPGEAAAQFTVSQLEFADPTATISGSGGWVAVPGMFWTAQALELHAGTVEQIFVAPQRLAFPFEGNGFRPMVTSIVGDIAEGRLVSTIHSPDATRAVFRTLDRLEAAARRTPISAV